ncbi:hypothetical protein QVD99_008460 [Batrachochytrium dendrobatidis]|nr:hypothetical protein QVD99_008460 [Batrachochytrium dendrobatidis]
MSSVTEPLPNRTRCQPSISKSRNSPCTFYSQSRTSVKSKKPTTRNQSMMYDYQQSFTTLGMHADTNSRHLPHAPSEPIGYEQPSMTRPQLSADISDTTQEYPSMPLGTSQLQTAMTAPNSTSASSAICIKSFARIPQESSNDSISSHSTTTLSSHTSDTNIALAPSIFQHPALCDNTGLVSPPMSGDCDGVGVFADDSSHQQDSYLDSIAMNKTTSSNYHSPIEYHTALDIFSPLQYSLLSSTSSLIHSDAATAIEKLTPPTPAHPHFALNNTMRSHTATPIANAHTSTARSTMYQQQCNGHAQPLGMSITPTASNFTTRYSDHKQHQAQTNYWARTLSETGLNDSFASFTSLRPLMQRRVCVDGRHQMIFRSIDENTIADLRILNLSVLPVTYNDQFYKDVIQTHSVEMSCLAYLNGQAVGGITCRKEACSDSLFRVYIMTLSVLAPYRRLKIGSMLLDTIMNNIKHDCTLDHLCLHVQTTNEQALGFYGRNGFHIHSRLDGYYGRNKGVEPPHAYFLCRKLKHHTDTCNTDIEGARCKRDTMLALPKIYVNHGYNETELF